MIYVKLNTQITDHHRFMEAGAVGRDLWTWGMAYAGKHETDGELPMAAVLSTPWGAGGKANIKVATKLVAVGLWERTDAGFRICRWSEQGNRTRAQLVEDRAGARSRMKQRRSAKEAQVSEKTQNEVECSGEQNANEQRTSPDVPTSTSISNSSDLRGGAGGEAPEVPDTPPEWFVAAAASVSMAAVVDIEPATAWMRYAGHRSQKRKPLEAGDARYWLTTVIVPEVRGTGRGGKPPPGPSPRARRDLSGFQP